MRRLLLVPLSVLLASACGASSRPAAAPSPTLSPTPSASPAAICPNQESGGSCLGALSAGSYASAGFATPLTYSVPAGWSNQEDINGRFLLLPTGSDRTGVEEGTADFIGVYNPVVAAAASCADDGEPGVDPTPAAIAAELAKRPGLVATAVQPVTLGALSGTTLDLRLAPGWMKGCRDDTQPLVPLFSGGRPPELVGHAVTKGIVTRLYLLASDAGTTVVQVVDATGGKHLAALDAVARTVRFT